MQDFPAANDDGQRLTITNSSELPASRSEMRGVLMVAAAFPVLRTVTVLVVMLPTSHRAEVDTRRRHGNHRSRRGSYGLDNLRRS